MSAPRLRIPACRNHDQKPGVAAAFLRWTFARAVFHRGYVAGAWSDTFSRKWPLVAGHGFLAAGMMLTGLVTAYPLILCTQVLWGLGWAFSGGADVAWLTGCPRRY